MDVFIIILIVGLAFTVPSIFIIVGLLFVTRHNNNLQDFTMA